MFLFFPTETNFLVLGSQCLFWERGFQLTMRLLGLRTRSLTKRVECEKRRYSQLRSLLTVESYVTRSEVSFANLPSSQRIPLKSTLMLSVHLFLDIQSGNFPRSFSTQNFMHAFFVSSKTQAQPTLSF